MSQKTEKPFNLLYKVDAQLTFVDKLYEIVVGPARMVVVIVMVIILIVFGFRFTLDSQLNDEVKAGTQNANRINLEVAPAEKKFLETKQKIDMVEKYMILYRDNQGTLPEGSTESLYRSALVMEEIVRARDTFGDNILISNYSFSTNKGTRIKLSGGARSFADIDSFLTSIRTINSVLEATSPSQSSSRGEAPKFSIDIILKDQQDE